MKNYSLFLDTSNCLTMGILDENYSWIDYLEYDQVKSATLLHPTIYNLMDKHKLLMENLSELIYIAGPGSYTGVRIGDGMAQIFEWAGIETFSFYHHKVPSLLDVNEGLWITNAHKKETFFYRWNNAENTNSAELISNDSFDLNGFDNIYSNFFEDKEYISTKTMIKENSQKLFPIVKEKKLKEEVFYFRFLEQEFTLKPKREKQ